MSLAHTRHIIDAIHSGELSQAEFVTDPNFGFTVPTRCPAVPCQMLQPKLAWPDPASYAAAAHRLASLFHANSRQFADQSAQPLASAGPLVSE